MELNLKRLRAERIAKGYTQEEMANKLEWNRGSYSKRENGTVNIGANELVKIAEILGYAPNDIGIFFTSNVPEKERNEKTKFVS